ncbi:hypothetical protein GPA10_35635 [Streptomyces sp. p1417]|uniref:Uncharacterized protein n=1 Tax=Streptomyces typhae TaxID=2681492 RepID=A0A6L6X7U3_9ACTN|nr:hypothetical protein [Streptomyces typhae]
MAGSASKDDLAAPRVPKPRQRRRFHRRAPPGRPSIRGVIVLTVKLFGETLEAPRTLAVWHVRTAK